MVKHLLCGSQQFREVSTLIKFPLQIRQLRFREVAPVPKVTESVSEGVHSGLLTSAHVVWIACFPPLGQNTLTSFSPGLDSASTNCSCGSHASQCSRHPHHPTAQLPPHNRPLGQVGLRDQRPREAKPQHPVPKRNMEPRTNHLGSCIQSGNGKPICGPCHGSVEASGGRWPVFKS